MTHHQIHNVFDLVAITVVWVVGLAYKAIAAFIVWFVGLFFHTKMNIDLATFNEILHTIILILGGVLTLVKLVPVVKGWLNGRFKKKRKFKKRK